MIMRFLKNNPGLKLISVVISLIIWLVVINVSKPEVVREQTVSLEVENQSAFDSESKTWEIDKSSVRVSYTVRTDQQYNISAKDFRAYVDLRDYSITGSVPIYVEVLNDKDELIQNVTPKPAVVHVSIEDMQEKKFTVNVRQHGDVAEGYKVGSVILPTDTLYAKGPVSEIGRISSIGIQVELDGLTEDKSGSETLRFYDANGNEIRDITDVTLSSETVSYTVILYKQKTVSLTAAVNGTPADGYRYSSVLISPATVKLAGRPALMDALTSLSLPALDVSGASASVTETLSIEDWLPEGVELAEPSVDVTVTAYVEKLPETTEESSAEGPDADMTTAVAGSETTAESSGSRHGESSTAENAQESTTRHETVRESASVHETTVKENPAPSGTDSANANTAIREVEQESSAQEHGKS